MIFCNPKKKMAFKISFVSALLGEYTVIHKDPKQVQKDIA